MGNGSSRDRHYPLAISHVYGYQASLSYHYGPTCRGHRGILCVLCILRDEDIQMDLGLRNKTAMVGGASKGLGFAVARALAAEGARVSIASRDADAIKRAADTISRETGGDAFAVAADLSQADAIAH